MSENRILELKSENRLLRKQIKEVQNRFEDKIAELSMIREIGTALAHINSFRQTCRIILNVIMDSTIAQDCSIMLMDQDKNQLFLAAATGLREKDYIIEADRVFSKEGVKYMFRPGTGVAGKAILEKRPVLVRDTQTCSFFVHDIKSKVKKGCLLSIPLIVEDEALGVLNLSHSNSNIFEASYINLFSIISNFIALSVHSTLNYEKLKYSESKYRALSEDSNDGIAIIQDSFHIYANPKYQELTGYSLEDLENISVETLLRIPDWTKAFNRSQHFLKKDSGHGQFEAQLFGNMGIKAEVEINSSEIIYNGKDAIIISVRDLADRKKLESQLQHIQKIESLGTIASGVAHNFRNILSNISVNNQLIQMKYQDDGALMAIIEKAGNAVDRGARLVDSLMQFARKEGKKDFRALNLAELIQEVFDLTRKSFDRKIDIRISIPGSIPVIGDYSGLTQVFMNLCVNARDAMSGGGELRIEARRREDMVEVSVSDTGHGMDREVLERCFDPFFTTKDAGKGTGLGLSTSYRIIKEHDGDIHA
ncbi:MAG: PAS domain S-box protein, partial [Deltaproteobacteria bacterium]|nr:PAS domain S-box protein [Deltaproteobacteria bacterium]